MSIRPILRLLEARPTYGPIVMKTRGEPRPAFSGLDAGTSLTS